MPNLLPLPLTVITVTYRTSLSSYSAAATDDGFPVVAANELLPQPEKKKEEEEERSLLRYCRAHLPRYVREL